MKVVSGGMLGEGDIILVVADTKSASLAGGTLEVRPRERETGRYIWREQICLPAKKGPLGFSAAATERLTVWALVSPRAS